MVDLLFFALVVALFPVHMHAADSTDDSAARYQASTLLNSVTRSTTLQQRYLGRWNRFRDRPVSLDLHSSFNHVFGFDLLTYNAGNDEYEITELNLMRLYNSITVAIKLPWVSGLIAQSPQRDVPRIGFTAAGYRYGLRSHLKIDRGNAQVGTVTDLAHPQFFDDLYALTLRWWPYGTLHAGYITNNMYVPTDNGQIDYFAPDESNDNFFYSVNVGGTITAQQNINEGEIERSEYSLNVNAVLNWFWDLDEYYYPELELGYESLNAYRDAPYDAVWVGSPPEEGQEQERYYENDARLRVGSASISQAFIPNLGLRLYLGAQHINEDIYNRDTREQIEIDLVREAYATLDWDPAHGSPDWESRVYLGVSRYWDPAVGIHRDDGGDEHIYGFGFGGEAISDVTPGLADSGGGGLIEAGLHISRNFSPELRTLADITDRWTATLVFSIGGYIR